jgi:glycosyltransferase involved in cell wall biosynthesis
MRNNVCHITSVHQPGDARIFLKECTTLAAAGFEVTLIYCTTGPREEKVSNGVRLIGVPRTGTGRFSRMIKDTRAVIEEGLRTGATVFHFHDPELIPHAIRLYKKGYTVFYDAHEDLPLQIMSKHYLPGFIRSTVAAIMRMIETRMSKRVSGIIAATPSIGTKFKRTQSNTEVIFNFPRLDELLVKDIPFEQRENALCYIGGIMKTRGIVELIDAMDGLPYPLHLCGSFSPESLRLEVINKPGWQQVEEHGFLNRKGVLDILTRSKVGIVTLLPSPNYIDAYPVKMFEYMAAGLAVVASDFPLWREIVTSAQCGINVDPADPSAIHRAIDTLLKDDEQCRKLGENGQRAVIEKYNWEQEGKKLVQFYKRTIETTSGKTRN